MLLGNEFDGGDLVAVVLEIGNMVLLGMTNLIVKTILGVRMARLFCFWLYLVPRLLVDVISIGFKFGRILHWFISKYYCK